MNEYTVDLALEENDEENFKLIILKDDCITNYRNSLSHCFLRALGHHMVIFNMNITKKTADPRQGNGASKTVNRRYLIAYFVAIQRQMII